MKPAFFRLLSALLLILLLIPLCVQAAGIDPDRPCSLTLHYSPGDMAFEDLSVSVYRVARMESDGTCVLTEPFTAYPVNIHGITAQAEWKRLAAALWGYVVADSIAPTAVETTDENGTAVFSGLDAGLYLVSGATVQRGLETFVFHEFMIYLPTPAEDGSASYDVEAKPKYTSSLSAVEYRVTKLWKDEGHSEQRPQSVTVDIFKNGQLHDSQTLSQYNDWTHSWIDSSGAVWTVAERDVPDGYQVSLENNGAEFLVINTCPDQPDPPDTGDTFPLYGWIVALCLSGMVLVLLGMTGRRER